MKVVITGGAGFIGSHIAIYHQKKGDEVWVIDDLSAGDLNHFDFTLFRFSKTDMTIGSTLKEALDWADRVYHLAASVGQTRVLADPMQAFLNNCQCCEILFKYIKPHHQVFIASSASVYWYGVIGDQVLKEDSILKLPSKNARQMGYGLSKIVAENLAELSSQRVIIGRLFNIYGPHQKSAYGSVIPRWIEQAKKNEPLTLYGDGKQLRSFCYVDDAIDAIELLFKKSSGRGEIYNIGSMPLVSLLELSQIVTSIIKSESKTLFIPYEKAYGFEFHEAENIVPSFEKIQKLGFSPKISLKEGLSRIAK